MKYCPQCGNLVASMDRFCGNCGVNLSSPGQKSEVTPIAFQYISSSQNPYYQQRMGFVQQTSWAQPVELGHYQSQREQNGFDYIDKTPRQRSKSIVSITLVAILATAVLAMVIGTIAIGAFDIFPSSTTLPNTNSSANLSTGTSPSNISPSVNTPSSTNSPNTNSSLSPPPSVTPSNTSPPANPLPTTDPPSTNPYSGPTTPTGPSCH